MTNQAIICDIGETEYTYNVEDADALPSLVRDQSSTCSKNITLQKALQVPTQVISTTCGSCSGTECDSIFGQAMEIRTLFDFTDVMTIRKSPNNSPSLPRYLFDTINITHKIISPFGVELGTITTGDLSCVPATWDNEDTLLSFNPQQIGSYLLETTIVYKQDGDVVMQCVVTNKKLVCPRFDITRIECNKFRITNLASPGTKGTINKFLPDGTTEVVVENTGLPVNFGESVEVELPSDGVYSLEYAATGSESETMVFIADCNFQKCVFEKIKGIGTGCGCDCDCDDCSSSRYDMGSLAISGSAYFLLIAHDNDIYSKIFKPLDSESLKKIVNMVCIIEGLQNYCCSDPCKNC